MDEIWEMDSCAWQDLPHRDRLLAKGWEPFAVFGMAIWFRRLAKSR